MESFEFDDTINSDIGCFIEINLFGKIMESINLLEAIYILDINNYFKDTEKFLMNFRDLEKNKNGFFNINEINDNVKTFLMNVGITKLNKFNKFDKNSKLLIKGF